MINQKLLNRSNALTCSAIVGAASTMLAQQPAIAQNVHPTVDRPNVLMLVVDDWNDWLPAMGHNEVITPNLDKLAARGVTFQYGHASATYCAPSRTSLMTGMNATTTGAYRDQIFYYDDPTIMDIPRYFKQNGYKTVGAGKLYHHMPGCIDTRSWDEYFIWNEDFRNLGWPYYAWDGESSCIPKKLPVSDVGQAIMDWKNNPNPPTHWMDFGAIPNEDESRMADTITTDFGAEFHPRFRQRARQGRHRLLRDARRART